MIRLIKMCSLSPSAMLVAITPSPVYHRTIHNYTWQSRDHWTSRI